MKVSYFREMREHHLVITDGEYICPDYQIKMVHIMNGNMEMYSIPNMVVDLLCY